MQAENDRAVIGDNKPPTIAEELALKYRESGGEIDRIAADANAAPKKVRNGDDLVSIGKVVTDAKKMAKRLKANMADEKEPHLEANKQIGAFFSAWQDRLDRISDTLEERASDYQREQAAEARRKAEAEAEAARVKAAEERKRADELAATGAKGAAKALGKAERLEDQADRHERKADAKAADLTRVRSASGVTASAKTTWKGEITDLKTIDLETLRPFLKRDDIQTALNTFVRIGNRELTGARIFEETKASFRA